MMDSKPSFFKPTNHRNNRRAPWHDYTGRSLYMLTFTCEEQRPDLSTIVDYRGNIQTIPTRLGLEIESEIINLPRYHSEVKLYDYVIMPDHIHVIIFVERVLPRPLGMILTGFIGACNRHYSCLFSVAFSNKLFKQGFHDRIIMRPGQLDTCRRYVKDNPYRLAIKRRYPDLFRRYTRLLIGDSEFAAYGNIFLLRDFDRQQVIVHRADSAEARKTNECRWLACADNGGVLVSPFISPDEKAIRDKAIKIGGRIIVIRNESFEKRFKPHGREFDLCAQGRLLLLAPWRDKLRRSKVSRAESLYMNSLAEKICYYEGAIKLIP